MTTKTWPRVLVTAEDVTAEVLAAAERVWDYDFADSRRIDWRAFIDELASYGLVADVPYDFESYDNAAVRRVKAHVRALRGGAQ